jgi:hypothetical protein
MSNLKWDRNYWIKQVNLDNPFGDKPELNLERLNVLFQVAREIDKDLLKERGVILGSNALVYHQHQSSYVYFRDHIGTFAILKDMRPDIHNKITYFAWRSGHWVRSKDVEAETEL